jgi:AcrR family transcriptional regulator
MYAGMDADQRRGERRARLLDAALELFGTRGYARTTIEQLCSEAGVSTRHFYECFDGREELLAAVYAEAIQGVTMRVLTARDAAPAEPEPRFRAGIDAFCQALAGDERIARVVLLEVVGVSPALEAARHGVIRAFAALAEAEATLLSEQGALEPRDWELTAIGVVGAIHELLIDWLLRDRPHPVERVVDEGVRLALGALRD